MANRPIPVKVANEMIAEYQAFMKIAGFQNETQYISFASPELLKWLDAVRESMDELRICLGVYPPDHEKAGRLTSILWPYKDGKPAKRSLPANTRKKKDDEGNEDGDGDDDGDGGPYPTGEIEPFNEGQTSP